MLVISRKLGERITVGDGVEITVVQVCGTKVRLEVTAPNNIAVDRLEVQRWMRQTHSKEQNSGLSLRGD